MITFGARISYRSEQQFRSGGSSCSSVKNSKIKARKIKTGDDRIMIRKICSNESVSLIAQFLRERKIPYRLFEFAEPELSYGKSKTILDRFNNRPTLAKLIARFFPESNVSVPLRLNLREQKIIVFTGNDAYSKEAMALDAFPLSATTGLFALHRGNLTP